jgi:3-hydroxyisobutyrate dehydrogenase
MEGAADTVGFIGLGVMGSSMAGHLIKAGRKLCVHTRSKEKAATVLGAGARWSDGPAALAPACSVIFTMVGYPKDVEDLYFGPKGLIENAKPGTLLVDCTTSRPDLARRISAAAKARGLAAIDAPVSGGDIGAKNGTLTIMVGGEAPDFEAAKPLLERMGATVVLQGGPGAGQYTKMANQIAIASNLMGAVEAITYAKAAGLDPRTVLQSIGSGSAGSWQLNSMVPRMLGGDFEPGFYVKHFLKDLRIALDSAKSMKLDLPLLALAEKLFEAMQDEGYGDRGTQALYLLYERRAREGEKR